MRRGDDGVWRERAVQATLRFGGDPYPRKQEAALGGPGRMPVVLSMQTCPAAHAPCVPQAQARAAPRAQQRQPGRRLAGCWASAHRWCFLISEAGQGCVQGNQCL